MSKKLRELQAKKAAAAQEKAVSLQAASALLDKAATESRDLSDAEKAEFNKFKAAADAKGSDIERIQAQIDVEQELIAAQAHAGSVAVLAGNGADIRIEENSDADPTRGFKSAGDFFASVFSAAQAGQTGAQIDKRLLIGAAAPTTFGNESNGGDGGFLVPPQYSKDIWQLSLGEGSLLPFCDDVPIEGNAMVFPKDETTPWGLDGIRAYWQGEATAAQATKPVLGAEALRLKKLMALVPVSDELLSDSSAMTSFLPKKFARSIQWKSNEAILYGPGSYAPFGALSGNAAVTVAKDTGQATGTLTAANLANMIARLPEGSYGNAVWIINPDVLPALFTLTLGNYPIYLPMGTIGGIQVSPYGTLLGRPIMVSQHAKSFSNEGDVLLVDLNYYQTITKAGGIQTDTSMHLYFDAGATAFRATFRMDGQAKLSKPIDPANGSKQLSPFIKLGAR